MKKYRLIVCLMSMLVLAFHSTTAADDYSSYCDEWSVGSGKIKVGADWLYWQVSQDNLDAASILRSDQETTIRSCRPVSQNQDWNSGYRVNVSYEFCDLWDIGVYYTDLPTRSSSRHHRPETTNVSFEKLGSSFFFSDFINPQPLKTLHAKWRSELSWLDLDISRAICFGESLTLRPHIGFRALWNNRTFHLRGKFVSDTDNSTKESQEDDPLAPYFAAHLKDDVTGYGTEGGLWGNWEIGGGLSVVGHVGGSILYTKHRSHQISADRYYPEGSTASVANVATADAGTTEKPAQQTSQNPIRYRHSQFFGVPTMDYFIGLQYESTFCDFILTTTIGWEQHIFFDINRISRNRGNLSAQGLTLGLEAAF